MYLWSIDIDAVLTAMSCFRLLCEEAEIRCGADELAVTQLLPNYAIYSELAAASTVLTTGQKSLSISDALKLDHQHWPLVSTVVPRAGSGSCGFF